MRISDAILWEKAQREGRILVTTDKGFTSRRLQPHCGILIVRLRQPNRVKIHQRVLQALTVVAEEQWPSLLIVMRDQTQSAWRHRGSEE